MSFTFMPAVREQVSVLIALAGASGSGKTKSALRLAQGISPAGKIAFMDTEARRGLHYADAHKFIHADMRPPFRPDRFLEGIRAAERAGAEVVIIDSFSNEYDGEGGIIDWADDLADGTPKTGIERPRKKTESVDWWKDWSVRPVESPGNWKEPKLAHKKMMNAILQCRASLIFCLRADEKIAIEKQEVEENGRKRTKTVVVPLGWMPICEKRFMFDMTVSFTLTPGEQRGKVRYDLPHKAYDIHREIFPDGSLFSEDAGRRLADWARGGSPAPAAIASELLIAGSVQTANPVDLDALIIAGNDAASRGKESLQVWWKALQGVERGELGEGRRDAWAKTAIEIDRQAVAMDDAERVTVVQ